MQGSSNITEVASANSNLEPYILVVGNYVHVEQVFLVIDQKVVMEVKIGDLPLVVMSCTIYVTLWVALISMPFLKFSL